MEEEVSSFCVMVFLCIEAWKWVFWIFGSWYYYISMRRKKEPQVMKADESVVDRVCYVLYICISIM